MNAFLKLFKNKKPIIGMVHLPPLPGSPLYDGTHLSSIIEYSEAEASKLVDGGVDGVLIENLNDVPFSKSSISNEGYLFFKEIVRNIVKSFSVPVGVNVLRNGCVYAARISYETGATFIRANILIGESITPAGRIEGAARELFTYLKNIDRKIFVLGDILSKHSMPIYPNEIYSAVLETSERGLADILLVTGMRTGSPPDIKLVYKASQLSDKPIFVGSGVNIHNFRKYLLLSDGAIVGTYFKKDGLTKNPINKERVEQFIDEVNKFRVCF